MEPQILIDQPVGRRIDSVTMSMIDTYLKSYEGIDAKYQKRQNDAVTASRKKMLEALRAIPEISRSPEEQQLMIRLSNSDISIYQYQEAKYKDYDEVSAKICKLVEDALLHKFISPFDREHEYMYVKKVYMVRSCRSCSPYETLWLEGPMIRVNGIGTNDQAIVVNFHERHSRLTCVKIVEHETIEKDFKHFCDTVMENVDVYKVLCHIDEE